MLEKPFRLVGSVLKKACVIKLKYQEKYVIVKVKDSMTGLKNIENGLNAFLRGGKINEGGLYFHLYKYVMEHPEGSFEVEYLLDSDNVYQLLKKEQEELDAGRSNPNMLNNQVLAYIPQYDHESGAYGWIPRNAVLNYRKWLKARRSKKTVA